MDAPENKQPVENRPEETTNKTKQPVDPSIFRGPLAWMAQNHIAANLVFFMFIIAGIVMLPSLKKELMPNTEAQRIMVSASYPGSTPDEVEEGIVIAIEESVRGIDGIKTMTSTASEGSGSVQLELQDGADVMRTKNEIERAVNQITTFPDDMEKPVVREMTRKSVVLSVLVYGDVGKAALREVAQDVRDDLMLQNGVSIVELSNVESPEVAVEISQEAVQKYGLKLQEVASAISSSSVDLSAGNLKAESGAVTLRTTLRKRYASEFENVVLKTSSDGRVVRLSDVATVTDTFEESDYSASYNGLPAVQLQVYSVGNETPVGVSDAGTQYATSKIIFNGEEKTVYMLGDAGRYEEESAYKTTDVWEAIVPEGYDGVCFGYYNTKLLDQLPDGVTKAYSYDYYRKGDMYYFRCA